MVFAFSLFVSHQSFFWCIGKAVFLESDKFSGYLHPCSLIRVYVVRRIFASLVIKHAHSEDSDQTARMHRLIRIFLGAHVILSEWDRSQEC